MDNAEFREHLRKCVNDPVYFIEEYVKVIHPIRGLVPFTLYPFQKEIVSDIEDHRFNILRKFRQAGCTTIASAYALWFCMFNKYKTVAVLSKGDIEAVEVLDRVKVMYDELPEYIKKLAPIKANNKHTFEFANGSILKSRASGKQSGRGLSGSLLIVDEAAFIEHIDTIWAAVYPVISTGGRVFVLSTVNGVGNWYYEQYMKGCAKKSDFNVIDIHWKQHPEYYPIEGYEDLYYENPSHNEPGDWERITRGNMSHKQWLQEYLCEFLGTGQTFIDGQVLKQLTDSVNEDFREEYADRLRIWKDPHPNHEYLVFTDTALGRELDYTAFQLLDLYSGEQVGEFYSNITPLEEVADIMDEVGRRYNTAYLAYEHNGYGEALGQILIHKLDYDNILSDENGDLGFKVGPKNRDQMLVDMEMYVRSRKIKLNSVRSVTELCTFVIKENMKIEADEGTHDDLVMSLAGAIRAIRHVLATTWMETQIELTDPSPEHLSATRNNKLLKVGDNQWITKEDYDWLMS